MASVFLSYDRDDFTAAGSVARLLEKAGHRVWWDREIAGGSEYSREIEQALTDAEAVVVLWSARSVQSPWVRDEAASGRDRGRLVPVRLDATEPPLGFRQYQTVDVRRGRIGKAQQRALFHAIATATGAPARKTQKTRPSLALPGRIWLIVGAIVAFAILGGMALLWRPWADRNGIVLAVGPASGDAASQTLARDLAIKLGSLQSPMAGNVKIVEAADAKDADLMFEAASSGSASATLLFKSARDSAILWSGDYSQPTGRRADLLQQLAYTAGRVSHCATEGMQDPVRLKPDLLRAYLNACAQLSEIGTVDEPPVAGLLKVVESSPRFTPAWSKLLLLEADLASPKANEGEVNPGAIATLRRHIAQARKADPDLPEALIAEASLLPSRDFAGRDRLIRSAAARSPENPFVLMELAKTLADQGHMGEGVKTIAKAVRLDPLSPIVHRDYIALLTYAGSFDAARRELAEAERLWPGTESTRDSNYRYHLRYGDPKVARTLFEQRADVGGRGPRLLLAAREDPSPQNISALLTLVRDRLANMENPSAGLGFATLAFGQFSSKEELFSLLLGWPKSDDIAIVSEVFFRPEFTELRRDPRFLLIARRAGLLDLWQQSGKWPDFCSSPGHTYDCRAVAAKLK